MPNYGDKKERVYSTQMRPHSKTDWVNYREGVEHCHIVPPINGWIDDGAQNLQWLKRQKEYTMIADLRQNAKENL